jgi:hypothetical protein
VAGAPAGTLGAGVCVLCPGAAAGFVVRPEGFADGDDAAGWLADVEDCAGWLADVEDCAGWLADVEDLAVSLAFGEAAGVWLTVGEAFPVLVCVPVDIGDAGGIDGAVEPEELVHAEMAVKTRAAKMAQLTAVSLALTAVPVAIKRTFMKPPYMPGGRPYR